MHFVHRSFSCSIPWPKPFRSGWWFSHPSEKYELVNWDDDIDPILMGKIKFMATIHHQPYPTI